MKLKTPGRRGWIFAVVVGGIALALPYVIPGGAHHGWWDRIPGWWGWFGGIGCALLVTVAKTLGHLFIYQSEDWYE
ncbi:hypothetical protein ACFL6M_03275 [Candidatus Eisenbacteria bacterium]|uniref:Uncharacterized protein n=1 Tax=Eiseniibacteriota bacterium TaxID=2212470 RepID=A0ABV6YJT8_UNCEI